MNKMPVTVVRSLELLGLFLIGTLVVIGKIIIMPLLLAFFLSLLLMPVFRFLRKLRIPELLAISLAMLLLAIFLALAIWLFSSQLISLINDYPALQTNVTKHLTTFRVWVSDTFHYSLPDQMKFINEHSSNLFNSAGDIMSYLANAVSSGLFFFGLLPVYIFLIMLYRHLFFKFILLWVQPDQYPKVKEVMQLVETIVMRYLIGLLIQITYIIVLLGVTLMIVGIKHGLLIGILFAFLNLVPYLGPLVGNLIGALITLASAGSIVDVGVVIGVIGIVQFLDNNILMPRIVGSRVSINPLVSIVSIFIGGAMAGTSGMFLAMPVVAVLKIVFDHSPRFAQWGVLFGDDRTKQTKTEPQS